MPFLYPIAECCGKGNGFMTKKMFYQNPYLSEFTSEVRSCTETQGQYAVVLAETLFYPEGGGQPADRGTLGGIQVEDVQEQDGEVVHFLSCPIPVGVSVLGKVDFPYRFSLMQQHSGEHIFSGIAHETFGCRNVGFHMNEAFVSVDFDRPLSLDELLEIETESNRRIFKNLEITSFFLSSANADTVAYRFKKKISGEIRIVEIPQTDRCACCGLHVFRTGEIGLLKVESFQNYKGGVRVFLKIGEQALIDYRQKNRELHSLAAALSVRPEEAYASVCRLLKDGDRKKQERNSLENRYFQLLSDSLPKSSRLCVYEPDLDADAVSRLACLLGEEKERSCCAVLSGMPGHFLYAVASSSDVRPLCRWLNEHFSGKGGGKKELCRGSLSVGTYQEIEREIMLFETGTGGH